MHGKTHKYEGMRHTYWYAAMSEDAVQRSRWTFYEVVKVTRVTMKFIVLWLTAFASSCEARHPTV